MFLNIVFGFLFLFHCCYLFVCSWSLNVQSLTAILHGTSSVVCQPNDHSQLAARIDVNRSGAHLLDTKGTLEEVDDRSEDRTRNLST